MEETDKKIAQVIASLIVGITVFVGLDSLVHSLALSDIPSFLLPYWSYIQQFFDNSHIILIVAFGRNILGYLRNYFRTKYTAVYNVNKLYETWMYYIGGLTTVLVCVPTPYNAMAAAIIVLLDFVTSEIKKLKTGLPPA